MKNEFGNTNSKEIWDNHLLCAQFLRGYSGVPLLEHVQPEDITDETEKLRPFLGVEFEGDAVKKVRVPRPEPGTSLEAGSRSGSEPEPRPQSKSESRPESRTESKPESEPESRPDSKPESRPGFKPESRTESRPESRPGFGSEAPELKPGADPEGLEESLPVYVVALLEHKSRVDYDVCFQLLKYMTGIWTLYRNECDSHDPRASSRKGFRYPLVIPIVYYEGRERWTAAMHWRERVELSEMFGEYVPDFTYRVVSLNGYSAEELLSREEELSLVMLFNRIQSAEDMDFRKWPEERREAARKILEKAPEGVLRLLGQIIHHFGLKVNVPEDELRRYVRNVEDRNMGELWADMEKIDIQEERRRTAEARKRLEEARETIAAQSNSLAEKDHTIAALRAEIARLKK